MKNMSLKPYGNFTNKGSFKIDYKKIPLVKIPDYRNSQVNLFIVFFKNF